MIRVCFAMPGVLPMLRRQPGVVYGGSELRAWRFTRGLAKRGFAVSLISFDEEDPPGDAIGLVTLIGPRAAGYWSGLFRRRAKGAEGAQITAWERANADVYVVFGASDYSANLAAWCEAGHRALVLVAGSDLDFSLEYRPTNTAINPCGSRCDRCYTAVSKASVIVVQTELQRRLARERFGRDVQIITNPIELPPLEPPPLERYVLWIGKSDRLKRPEIAVEVARRCPGIPFRLIVNRVDGPMLEGLRAGAPSNVSVLESIPPAEMRQQYLGAFALLNTSVIEGFPNAVLEAGSFGVPLLSLSVDPGEIIAREGGGATADGDVDALAAFVRRYHAEPEIASAAGRRLQDYIRRNHEASARIAEFSDLILRLASNKERHARGIA
jgi:glycosyltransferase involved in cell wall biosynthesis